MVCFSMFYNMDRLFITVNDIVALKGVCYKTACKIFNRIIKKYDLPKEREISMKAFCEYYNVHEDKVNAILDKKNKLSIKPPRSSTTIMDSIWFIDLFAGSGGILFEVLIGYPPYRPYRYGLFTVGGCRLWVFSF